jgi:pSer/pThr/pTyr-binding forkhead associated (FHA) protein/tetratricopeptide (TPR) repeat protein
VPTAVDRELQQQMTDDEEEDERDLFPTGEHASSEMLELSGQELESVDSHELSTPLVDDPEVAPMPPRHLRPTLPPKAAMAYPPTDMPPLADPLEGNDQGFAAEFPSEMENAPTRIEREEDIRAAQGEDTPAAGPRLMIIGGNNRGKEFVLNFGDNSIGRGMENTIILADIAVSRKHTLVLFEGNQFVLRDLGSGNGTLLNGSRVESSVLQDGDQLELGNTLMRLILPAPPASQLAHLETVVTPRQLVGGQMASPLVAPMMAPPVRQDTAVAQANQTKKVSQRLRLLFGELINTRIKRLIVFGSLGLLICFTLLAGLKSMISAKKGRTSSPVGVGLPPDELVAQEFNAGITQYNAKNWEESKQHFLKALQVAPNQDQVRQYVDKASAEIQAREAFERAKKALAGSEFDRARREIAKVNSNSIYHREATTLVQKIDDDEVIKLMARARELKGHGEIDQALEIAKKAQEIAPTSKAIRDLCAELKTSAAKGAKVSKKGPSIRPTPRPTPALTPTHAATKQTPKPTAPPTTSSGALALYKNRQWSAAYQAFKDYAAKQHGSRGRAAGAVADAAQKTGQFWTKAEKASSLDQRLRDFQQALTYDQKVSGSPHQAALKEKILQAAQKQVVAALGKGKYSEAYSAIKVGQSMRKNDPALQSAMNTLEKKAQELFNKGYTVRNTNLAQARQIWQTVLRMVPPTNAIYQKAYSWLNNSAPSDQDEDEE